MYEPAKRALFRLLRVPAEPEDPLGAGDSLLVFRAAPNYLRYKLVVWGIRWLVALPGLIITAAGFAAVANEAGDQGCIQAFLFFLTFLVLAVAAVSFPVSYALVRLDYEMRWYKVTDRSLRIREGVLNVREMTMTFANIQNISISQGPLQRMLDIADLKVQSAGGGGAANPQQQQQLGLDMHTGFFRGVDNAAEIRDMMRERLRALRDAGLGDPDAAEEETTAADTVPETESAWTEALTALRDEAILFRRAAERLSP